MNTTAARATVHRARLVAVVIAWATTAACSSDRSSQARGGTARFDAGALRTDASVAGELRTDASVADAGAGDASRVIEQTVPSLAVSPTHSCALRKAGVYCWGENFSGQLGNGATIASEVPVQASVVGKDVAELVAATGRTCVRTSTGKVQCWGANDHGQIGDGTRVDTLTPVEALGIDDAIALALDDESTCVIRKAGRTVACWGGGPEESWVPRTIEGLSSVLELRAGTSGSYCARDTGNTVWCWQSGNGAWAAPRQVEALAGARAVAVAGFDEVCALVEAGNIVCNSSDTGRSVPLDDSHDVVELNAAGSLAVCGHKSDGRWYCWNVLRQMLEEVGSPAIAIPTDQPLTELVFSGFRVCALRADKQVGCANANEVLTGLNDVDASALKVVEGLPD